MTKETNLLQEKLFSSFLQKLLIVENMTFSAKSLAGSQMGWNGQGSAAIEVNSHIDSQTRTVYLTETGQFLLQGAPKPTPLYNVFKLIFHETHIAFYQERFGADHSVWLFDLIEQNQDTLINRQVHQCVQDQYSVIVNIDHQNIKMHWRIAGPKKNELLCYHYF